MVVAVAKKRRKTRIPKIPKGDVVYASIIFLKEESLIIHPMMMKIIYDDDNI